MTTSATATEQVIFRIAEALDKDPADMKPLGEEIDADALNRLVQSNGVEVNFEYAGFNIFLRGPNEIDLTPL